MTRRSVGRLLLAAALLGAGATATLSQDTPRPAGSRSASFPKPSRFVVVGYLPDYRVGAIKDEAFAGTTDVIYFSIEPKANGELDTKRTTPEILKRLGEFKARNGFHLLLGVGGWGRSTDFARMSAVAKTRAKFVQALAKYCRDNGFDGASFNWEHPKTKDEEQAYGILMVDTKRAFVPQRLLLTAALADWQVVPKEGLEALDRIHVMAYDHTGKHSTFEQSVADIESFVKRGVPPAKIVLGLPFYGRLVKDANEQMTYKEIVERFHPGPESDEVEGIFFNGAATIRKKTRYAIEKGLGGVMIWELAQDSTGDSSLLKAITRANQP